MHGVSIIGDYQLGSGGVFHNPATFVIQNDRSQNQVELGSKSVTAKVWKQANRGKMKKYTLFPLPGEVS